MGNQALFDAANTATWVGHIAVIPRNHVNVQMKHGLPGSCAYVNPYIIAVRVIFGIQLLLYLNEQAGNSGGAPLFSKSHKLQLLTLWCFD